MKLWFRDEAQNLRPTEFDSARWRNGPDRTSNGSGSPSWSPRARDWKLHQEISRSRYAIRRRSWRWTGC